MKKIYLILWLSYSWPNMHFLGGVQVPGIDNHLAKSTDGGNSFTFVKNLFPSVAITNPANPSPQGYLESETSNLPLLLQPVSYFTRRNKTTGEFTARIWRTGVHP